MRRKRKVCSLSATFAVHRSVTLQTQGTTFHYVGEILRYLLLSPPSEYDRKHKIRSCLGNGLRSDIWAQFQKRFGIYNIAELYGSTEGNGNAFSLNVFNRPGAVGFNGLLYRYRMKDVMPRMFKIDLITEELIRDPKTGFCIECSAGEPGELLGRVLPLPGKPSGNWDGYYGNEQACVDDMDTFVPSTNSPR